MPRHQHDRVRERSFDNDAFFAALNSERSSRGITWKQLANEAGVNASTLTRMSQGRRPDVDSFAALIAWSGLDPDDFIGKIDSGTPEPLAEISVLLRRDPNLSKEAATALDSLVRATYERLRSA